MLAVPSIAAIELRFAPSVWPAHDVAISNKWDFSIVPMRNAQNRRG